MLVAQEPAGHHVFIHHFANAQRNLSLVLNEVEASFGRVDAQSNARVLRLKAPGLGPPWFERRVDGQPKPAEVDRLRLLPTLLSPPPDDVRQIIDAGKKIFRQSPELTRLLKDLREAR